ncbi:WbqC family protein [Hydrotalea sp.]|uniref:WbqC family protein n=1 Tax=Hydrotalea sp. TaxID=2881279 RepID=UPI002588BCE9|nr:WbqC family protein [Hydrotalea sp.]
MNNKLTLVIDNQFFINVELFKALLNFSNVKIEICDNWQKMSFRNRSMVAGANGLIGLTVPVLKGRDQKGLFKLVKIDYRSKWQQQHWRTIVSCYNRSPFFEYYADSLREVIFQEYALLFELNLATLQWAIQCLKFSVNLTYTDSFLPQYPNFVTDYRNRFSPNNFQNIDQPVYYPQVFEAKIGFQKNLSCIDIICCEGPNTINVLQTGV